MYPLAPLIYVRLTLGLSFRLGCTRLVPALLPLRSGRLGTLIEPTLLLFDPSGLGGRQLLLVPLVQSFVIPLNLARWLPVIISFWLDCPA